MRGGALRGSFLCDWQRGRLGYIRRSEWAQDRHPRKTNASTYRPPASQPRTQAFVVWYSIDLRVKSVAWLYVSCVREICRFAGCGVAWTAENELTLHSAVRCAVSLWHASCASRSIPTPTQVLVLGPSL